MPRSPHAALVGGTGTTHAPTNVLGNAAVVSGGRDNPTSASPSVVSGNRATADQSSVGGGHDDARLPHRSDL